MELRDLSTFEVIAALGHVGAAAERVGRTQPALSKCIRRLEDELGTDLFRRAGRGLVLTQAGAALAARATRLRLAAEEARREVRDHATGAAGHIRVGASATTAEGILPDAIATIVHTSPAVTIELRVGMNDVLHEALLRGDIDLLVIGPMPERTTELECRSIAVEEIIVLARRGHPLASRATTLASLAQARWALPGRGVAARRWLEETFAAHQLPSPIVAVETDAVQIRPRIVEATDLLTVMSRQSLSRHGARARLVQLPVPELIMSREVGVSWRTNGYLPPAALQLIATLTQTSPTANPRRL